jgi:hypothetical protein
MDEDEHNCPRCGYSTDLYANFKKHLERKYVCKAVLSDVNIDELRNKYTKVKIITHTCETCEKNFFSKTTYYSHKRECKSSESIQELKNEVNELKKKMLEMESNKASSSITNNNTTNNIITQQNITINMSDFSHEKIDHITPEFITECLKDMNIVRLLSHIHFDPSHPENHTVRIKNVNQNLLEYHQDGK